MKKEMFDTTIQVQYIQFRGMYTSVYQEQSIHQYPYSIHYIVFFDIDKDTKEYKRLGLVSADTRENLYTFCLKSPALTKFPVKRKEKATNELFFCIDHTLFIRGSAIDLIGPQYIKCDLRKDTNVMSEDSINFQLEEHWEWNEGYATFICRYDLQDYRDATSDLLYFTNHAYNADLKTIDELMELCKTTKNKIVSTMNWWRRATAKQLAEEYHNNKKGGNNNA